MVLKDKVAIVTGGASGIGEEICRVFAEAGAHIAVADFNAKAGDKVISKIEAKGRKGILLNVDIREYQAVTESVTRVIEIFGKLDILVNCAGFNKFIEVEEITPEFWQEIRSVNLDGSWNFCNAVIGPMIKRGRGKIINIGSAAAVLAIPKALPYVVAKHGVVGLTQALAVDLGPHNINVNCICPGPVETPLFESSTSASFRNGMIRSVPLARLGQPSDIAQAALFFASAGSDWITGATLPVDGGLLCCVRAHHFE